MNHQKLIETSLLTLLAGSALLSFSNQALASEDSKMHSGAECKPYGTATATGLQYLVDGIKNTSPITKTVICPLVRDAENNYSKSLPATLVIRGMRSNPQVVVCTVSQRADGVSKFAPSSGGFWTMTFNAWPFTNAAATIPDPVSLTCVLAPGGSITSYQMRELSSTQSP